MAVKLRLRRMGANKKPFFRIIAADVKSANEGSFIEEIGWYDPLKKEDNLKIDLAKAEAWIAKGAQPSETVASFIKRARKDPSVVAAAPAPAAEEAPQA